MHIVPAADGQDGHPVDLAFVYDAVEAEHGAHALVAICEKEQTTLLLDPIPAWAADMLALG